MTTFNITLIGHYWDLIPEYEIHCNSKLVCRKEIPTPDGVPHVESFESESADAHTIRVYFKNKASDQSVLNLSRTHVIRDMLLEVSELTVDGVCVDIPSTSVYHLLQRQIHHGNLTKIIPGVSVMGWKGYLEFQLK